MYLENHSIIHLSPLSSLAADDNDGAGLWADTELGKRFSKLVSKLVPKTLEGVSGFYCWVKAGQAKTEVIYIGQSHNLRRRLTEGLKHGRIAFWADYSMDKWESVGKEKYARKWRQYKQNTELHSKKAGSTHIIWMATPAIAHYRLELIETLLIEKFKPIANVQNKKIHKDFDKLKTEIKDDLTKIADDIIAGLQALTTHAPRDGIDGGLWQAQANRHESPSR